MTSRDVDEAVGDRRQLPTPASVPSDPQGRSAALTDRVEDAEPGCGEPDAGRPLPSPAVVGDVAVDEVAQEVAFADTWVHEQVSRQEGGRHQPGTVLIQPVAVS